MRRRWRVGEGVSKPTIVDSIEELLPRLYDLLHQATVERSHYYVGSILREVIVLLGHIRMQHKKNVSKKAKP